MAKLFKHIYDDDFFDLFSLTLKQVFKSFNKRQFITLVQDSEWQHRELKQRMKHIASILNNMLPGTYEEKILLILAMIPILRNRGIKDMNLEYMIFSEFIELYGLDYPDVSIPAIEKLTTFVSCEFAVRPFIIRYQDRMMKQMLEWAHSDNVWIRRLSSEGSRPRLPWGIGLPALKKDPTPLLPILECLKHDPAETVRKSVANNLNDIAKDNPDVVYEIITRWQGVSPETDWIIKHGARTLLRKADAKVMSAFGITKDSKIKISNLQTDKKSVEINDTLKFSFELTNHEKTPRKVRVEYGIYYVKSTGKISRKLFKITENIYKPGVSIPFTRNVSFKDRTIRKHYRGEHKLVIVINGAELAETTFKLK